MPQSTGPACPPFSALRLAREADGAVTFDVDVFAAACAAAGVTCATEDEDAVGSVLIAWYEQHLAAGGATDPVMQDLLEEIRAEDAFGDGLSHPPGRA